MSKKEQSEAMAMAIEKLRATFKPGDTVHTVLRHVSRSGMTRSISVLDADTCDISFLVARALGWPIDRNHYGVKVSGCGMDMGFHLVYTLSSVLFPDGFGCTGENREEYFFCPSCDHSNGDRDYSPHVYTPHNDGAKNHGHWHEDGGYALRQRWI